MPQIRRVAKERFARGYNCAQSLLSAFASRFGLTSQFAVRLAAPFGAGMAREGQVCGALSGALMVLGLQYAGTRPEDREQIYRIARDFIDQFETQHGSMICKELLGYDISTPAGLQAARDNGVFETICPVLVDETATALTTYLDDHPPI